MTGAASTRPTAQWGARAAEKAPRRNTASAGAKGTPEAATGRSDAILIAMSEREFQKILVDALSQRGFRVWTFPVMKLTRAGWPDLTFWHPRAHGRIWFWELKTQRGRIRPDQTVVLQHLATIPGADARIVRPLDWEWLRDKLDYERTGIEPLAAAAGEGE